MIQDVDQIIQRLLIAELSGLPGCAVRHADQIAFDSPASAEAVQDGRAHVNLYLHDVRENLELRDESFRVNRSERDGVASRRPAPVRLNLSYLVTVYAGEHTALEHRLLSQVLGVLLKHGAVPATYLMGVFQGLSSNTLSLSVAQPDAVGSADPAGLWQALGGRLRPSLSLKVGAPFDPFETQWTRLVRDAVLSFMPAPTNSNPASGNGQPQLSPNHAGLRNASSVARLGTGVAGIVLDQESEKPLKGVEVRVTGRTEQTTSDERGIFRLNLPAGTHVLRYSLRGFEERELPIVVRGGANEEIEPLVIALSEVSDAEYASQDIARWKTERSDSQMPAVANPLDDHHNVFAGRLRFADGSPAAFIPVSAGRQRSVTDAQGVYCFLGLPAQEQVLKAEIPGRGELEVVPNNGTAILDSLSPQ